ncbi:MAG: hypothetical protein QXV06_01430 [Ignisphaera sp.]
MRKVRSVEDIYVGGMNVGGVLTALSFFTTYFSSVVFVGATALGWKYGLPIVWKDVFVVLVGTLFAFIFLGARLTCLSRVLKFTSVVGFIEKRYKSRIAGVVASIIIFVGLLIYVVSILVGMVRAVEAVIVDIDYTSALLLITIVTAVYTAMGGYIAQVWTQAAQAIFMIGMALTICIASMLKVGGLFTLYQQLKSVDPSLAGWPYKDFLPLFSLYLSLGFLGWGNPALLLKFVSVRDRISLRTAVIISTTLVAVFTLSLNVASAASRLIVSGDVKPDHAFVYLVKYVLPQGFDIVFLIAILSASMSTITALLGVMTQTIRDLIGARLKLAHRYEVLFYRFTTIVLALISMILALKPPEMIVFLFGVTTSILAGVLTGPVVYGLYSRKITASSVVISMVISFALAIGISAYGSFRAPWTYYSFIPTILVSFMLPPIISSFKLKIN